MIDIHSHILFDVDDGAKTIEESIYMLKEAEVSGFTDIVLTPHYFEGRYEKQKEEIINKFTLLEERIKEEGLDLKLYLGNEIYVIPNVSERVSKKELLTLNDSKYVLIETHLTTNILYLEYEVERLLDNGFSPILAHPERYEFIKNDIKKVDEFINMGVLLQANYGSVIGVYGRTVQKIIKKLLKQEKIDFLASDTHFISSIYASMPEIERELYSLVSDEYFYYITEDNARKIIG